MDRLHSTRETHIMPTMAPLRRQATVVLESSGAHWAAEPSSEAWLYSAVGSSLAAPQPRGHHLFRPFQS